MFNYWYNIAKIFILRKFKKEIDVNQPLVRKIKVKALDCDAFRVMAAYKYLTYMDLIRWEQFARSRLLHAVFSRKLAPSLGSQKIIYRKPIKRNTTFFLHVEVAGWDEKWFYHIHTFVQNNEVKAVGVTKGLFWRKDKQHVLQEIVRESGFNDPNKTPPDWVINLFKQDSAIIQSSNEMFAVPQQGEFLSPAI